MPKESDLPKPTMITVEGIRVPVPFHTEKSARRMVREILHKQDETPRAKVIKPEGSLASVDPRGSYASAMTSPRGKIR